jgi:hypothetical protein
MAEILVSVGKIFCRDKRRKIIKTVKKILILFFLIALKGLQGVSVDSLIESVNTTKGTKKEEEKKEEEKKEEVTADEH